MCQFLLKPDAIGKLLKWEVEHSEFDISYKLRTTIKAQVLADFMAEMTSYKHVNCRYSSVSMPNHVSWLVLRHSPSTLPCPTMSTGMFFAILS